MLMTAPPNQAICNLPFDRPRRHIRWSILREMMFGLLNGAACRLIKICAAKYHAANHDFTIERGGICVYPRLSRSTTTTVHRIRRGPLTTGLKELTRLLGDGSFSPGTNALSARPGGRGLKRQTRGALA